MLAGIELILEIDDTLEDLEVFECLSSGSEWKQSGGEESSSEEEEIIDDDINNDLDHSAIGYSEDYEERFWQKPEKFIYGEDGCVLGRMLKEEDKVSCVKHKDIYIKKLRTNLKSKSGRFFDHMHPCFYCKNLFSQRWSHMQGKHREEPEVKEILNLKADRDMIDDCALKAKIEQIIIKKTRSLSNKADHEHNMRVMKLKKGELFLSRRNREGVFNSEAYGPCPECFSWLEIRQTYNNHRKRCPANVKGSLADIMIQNLIVQGKILASASKEMQENVFPLMPNDRLTKTAKSDPLIIALGELHLMDRIGRIEKRMYHASYRMRVAARLVHIFRKETKSETASMSDCLRVEHFDLLAKCAVQVVSKHSHKEIQHSLFGKRLGYDLLKLVSAKIGGLRKARNSKELEDSKKFYSLLQEQWKQAVQAQVIIVNKERKAQEKIELEERMERVKAFLDEEKINTNASPKNQRLKKSSTSLERAKKLNEHKLMKETQSEEKCILTESNLEQKISEDKSGKVSFEEGQETSDKGQESSDKRQDICKERQESAEEHCATSDEVMNTLGEVSKPCEKCDPEDFGRLARYLFEELDKHSAPNDISTPEKYRYLVTLTLAYLVLYNSCDPDKIRFLTLETYRRKLRQPGEVDTTLYIGITDLERELAETQDLIELRSATTRRQVERKRDQGNRIPIILPTGMTNILKHLANSTARQTCFVETKNDYLFATFDSELEPMGLQVALDVVRENADLNKPSGITVKNLKKYTSTICQITNLDEETLLDFVKDMGLTEKLNLEEGQSIAGVKDRLEIAKLIFLREQGKTEKLRTLDQITFEEIEREAATKDDSTNCNFDSDEEDNFGDYYQRKPRKKSSVPKETHIRVPWSKIENEEIYQYFDHYITLQTQRPCPGMKEILKACLKSKTSGGEIWKRDWEVIKKKVSYLIQKSKKKLNRERDESD